MSNNKNWFEIDAKGLSKLIERRGKIWLLHELISNSWDAAGTTHVEVVLEPEEGVPLATIVVRDDSTEGFSDMSHAFTLFAESSRKADATRRGRFCLGEKLVLALCNEASIISMKGAVMFDSRGRSNMRTRRERGTEFQGIARITRAELAEIKDGLKLLLSPPGVVTTINGEPLPMRTPLKTVEAKLLTEIADDEGVLRRKPRKTAVNIYTLAPGETAMLYELGVPVVETNDKFHVSVEQKIVLNMDRDGVTPAYLRDIRTLVVNAMHDHLDASDANATFVNEALADADVTPEAVTRALDLKYGEKRAIWDPSDPEANMNLVAQGYTLIKGAQLTGEQWANVKKHDAVRPAGQIAPTKKALFSPDGEDKWVPREKWTPAMRAVIEYTHTVASELLDSHISVRVLSDITESWAACFGEQQLVFNLGRLGHAFFDECASGPTDRLNQLIIHELGHHFAPNHLDETYHESLCKLGALFARLALRVPKIFLWSIPAARSA